MPAVRQPVRRYALALGILLIALVARLVLVPMDAGLVFSTFYAATVLALYFCGVGPGLLVTGLGACIGLYFFAPPQGSWAPGRIGAVALVAYLTSSLLTAWVVQQLRQTSRLLRTREQELRAVVEGQTDMLFRFDARGRFLFINPAGRQAFGLSDADIGRATWHVLVLPGEREAVDAVLASMSESNAVVRTESRFPGPAGGDMRWGEFVHRAFHDGEGRLTEVQTVAHDITERKCLQDENAATSATLRDLYDQAPCGYYSLDAEGCFLEANQTFLGWVGCSRDEVVGRLRVRDFMTAESQARFDENFPVFLAKGSIGPVPFDLVARDGRVRHVNVSASALKDAQGRFVSSRSVMYDFTELHRVQGELVALARQQEAMLDNDLIGIVKLKDRNAIWKNRALGRMFGYEPGELEGRPSRVLYLDDESYQAIGQAAYTTLREGGRYRTQLRMRRKDGSALWVDMSGVMLSPETGESMWMMLDISALKAHQERTEQIAFHDGLTGLPNRLMFMDRLCQAIPLAQRLNVLLAVCFIDLDGFKAVNDRLGHAAGDLLLQVVAQRLGECVRSNDTVARLGGDEFVLLLTHLQGRAEGEAVLHRVAAAVGEPVDLGQGRQGRVTASIGVAFFPTDGHQPDQLLGLADAAMYAAKQSGRNRIRTCSN